MTTRTLSVAVPAMSRLPATASFEALGPTDERHAADDDVEHAVLGLADGRARLVGELHHQDVALVHEGVDRQAGLVAALDRLVQVGDRGRGGVDVVHQDGQVPPRLRPLRVQRGRREVQAADQRRHLLDDLDAGGVGLRAVGHGLPAVPHVGEQGLDAVASGLPERRLHLLQRRGLGAEAGEVGVLGVPAALEEGRRGCG
nr:hypothetical protein [Blastococcus sp. TML/M2B]